MDFKYALLIDGGYMLKRLYKTLGGMHASAADVVADCEHICRSDVLKTGSLLRIYFYDAPPADGQIVNPLSGRATNLAKTDLYRRATSIHDKLELSPDFALRLGELAWRGWRINQRSLKKLAKAPRRLEASDLEPDFKQRGVDLRIGLDIARLALRRMLDVVVVVTGDSDMVPAFKFARREGVRVYLEYLDGEVMRDLKAHADLVL